MPGVVSENYWFRRHEAAYRYLAPEVRGGILVELGPGEGYGTAMLAAHAEHAVAIDYDGLSIRHLAAAYPGVSAVQGNLASIPVRSNAASTVASLQVIEHVWDHPQFVAECARVLAPGGLLIVTTPNRLTFSPGLGRRERPVNAYHCREYDADELGAELADWLPGWTVSLHGLGHGPRLRAWEAEHGDLAAAQQLTDPDQWSSGLSQLVRSVRCEDFELGTLDADCLDRCLDLVAVAQSSPVERRDALS